MDPPTRGGILPGDFITGIAGTEIKSQDELVRKVGDIPAGTTAAFDIIRAGKKLSLRVKIELRDKSVASNNKDLFPGLSAISLESDSVDKTKIPAGSKGGIIVTDVVAKSPASLMGVKPGDIIIKVNDKKIDGFDFLLFDNQRSAGEKADLYRGEGRTDLGYSCF